MIERAIYIAVCVLTLYAILHLQRYRYLDKGCGPFCAYTALAGAVVWEGVDCFLFGPPGFPSSRWLLLPMLMVVFGWEAIEDHLKRKKET